MLCELETWGAHNRKKTALSVASQMAAMQAISHLCQRGPAPTCIAATMGLPVAEQAVSVSCALQPPSSTLTRSA